MKRLRGHPHALSYVYIPAATLGLVGVEVFACPFIIAALLVMLVVALAAAVLG